MKMRKLPIGVSDFKDIITGEYYYVDKTLFIKEVIDSGDKILLLPRPRRFGKTLNMSMLKYYYDCCPERFVPVQNDRIPSNKNELPSNDYKHLFDTLLINNAGKSYSEKMGKYPVIFITFKDIKQSDWETCFNKIKQLIQDEYSLHYYLLSSNILLPSEMEYFEKMISLKGDKGDYENSLKRLMVYLSRYYGERVVVLIDEYDMPIHAGYNSGYYDEIIEFMRNFLGGGLKDMDSYLEKSVMTGIMRIARESIFSGLNNQGVYTLLSQEFNNWFGFTHNEVKNMLDDFNIPAMYDGVQLWYNGYIFGGKVIYNPWSIINFLRSSAKEFLPYWINTSDNQVVETLLSGGGKELKEDLEQLIRGESIEKAIDENIILKEVSLREDLLWSFLLMGGYLKSIEKRRDPASGKFYCTLAIPNEEVKSTYTGIIDRFFTTKIETKKLEIMLKALIDGDIELFEKMLKKVILAVFSYHDFSGEPEKVYHALVLGLLIWITNTHEVKSNRESGYGRYDIMIIPKDSAKIGYVIEFKAVDKDENESIESAVESALRQIEEKKYELELIERGVKEIRKLAIVFSGKEVFVKDQRN